MKRIFALFVVALFVGLAVAQMPTSAKPKPPKNFPTLEQVNHKMEEKMQELKESLANKKGLRERFGAYRETLTEQLQKMGLNGRKVEPLEDSEITQVLRQREEEYLNFVNDFRKKAEENKEQRQKEQAELRARAEELRAQLA
ncbi:hypothetical protein QOT17_022496 [Balamuthia mandrillaris]